MLRAPYFYPTNQVATENTNLCLQHWESPVYSKIGHVRICGGMASNGCLYPETSP